jgi:hypothetical protein
MVTLPATSTPANLAFIETRVGDLREPSRTFNGLHLNLVDNLAGARGRELEALVLDNAPVD